jgi:hypothetical protein
MAEIQFERRGTPLWKVVLLLLVVAVVAVGGWQLLGRGSAVDPRAATPGAASGATPAAGAADASRPQPPAGATPSPRPTTTGTP